MEFQTWWPALAAALPGIGAWLFTLYKARQDRIDKGDERRLTFEEKQEMAFQRERDRIYAESERQFNDLRKSNEAKDQAIDDLRKKMASILSVAYFWHGKSWDMRNKALQARQIAENAFVTMGKDPPNWGQTLDLPDFEVDSKNQKF